MPKGYGVYYEQMTEIPSAEEVAPRNGAVYLRAVGGMVDDGPQDTVVQ